MSLPQQSEAEVRALQKRAAAAKLALDKIQDYSETLVASGISAEGYISVSLNGMGYALSCEVDPLIKDLPHETIAAYIIQAINNAHYNLSQERDVLVTKVAKEFNVPLNALKDPTSLINE